MITYCIRFFPAGGYRHPDTGAPSLRGVGCFCLASSTQTETGGWYTEARSLSAAIGAWSRTAAYSVRCVA